MFATKAHVFIVKADSAVAGGHLLVARLVMLHFLLHHLLS